MDHSRFLFDRYVMHGCPDTSTLLSGRLLFHRRNVDGITKQGNGYLRRLLVVGATAVMRITRRTADRQPWTARLLEGKPAKTATTTLASKTARIAWAVMSRKEDYVAAIVWMSFALPCTAYEQECQGGASSDVNPVIPGVGKTQRVTALRAR